MTSATTFTSKQIRVTLTLVKTGQTFPDTGSNQLVLLGGLDPKTNTPGLRMSTLVEGAANYSNTLELRIWGMKSADMNALTTLFFGPSPTLIGDSTVLVESNDTTGWNQVFSGSITNASPQYNDMPDVSMLIQGIIGYSQGVGGTQPLSYPNGTSVAQVGQTVAGALGLGFANNGVSIQLPPGTYLPGTPRDQLNKLVQQGAFDYYISNGTLTLCQLYKGSSAATVSLTPQNGLIGYPMPGVGGIEFDCYFTPAIQLAGQVRITGSDVPYANGLWTIRTQSHQLDALLPDGKWQTHCTTTYAS